MYTPDGTCPRAAGTLSTRSVAQVEACGSGTTASGSLTAVRAWFIGAFLVVAAVGHAYAQESGEGKQAGPVHLSREADGTVVLTLDTETQQRVALTATPVKAASFPPTVTAFGKLEPDPSRLFTLRALVGGRLRTLPDQHWPGLGSVVEADAVLGYVEPSFTASEMVDLHARRWDAKAEFDAIDAEVDAARASYDSKHKLNEEQGLVSDRSMEETRARYKAAEARLVAARARVDLYDSLVTGRTPESSLFPIGAAGAGEIIEIAAQPGEIVDPGQVLLRTARYDTLIANVTLFPGDVVGSPLPEARISIVGADHSVLAGKPVGQVATASALTGGPAFLFKIDVPAGSGLRPGTAVTARIPTAGDLLTGVLIPHSAVLRHAGRTWSYVKAGANRFERREVELHEPTADGWFATSGVSPGESVVVAGAQSLLSEELKAQIEHEAEGGE